MMKPKIAVIFAIVLFCTMSAIAIGKFSHLRQENLRIRNDRQDLIEDRQQIKSEVETLQQKNQEVEKENSDLRQKNEDLEVELLHEQQTVAPAPPATTAKAQGGCEAYAGLVSSYGWDTSIAMAIMKAESGCNATAVSPTNDHGLFQINQGFALYGQVIYDPAKNVEIAYNQKYLRGGWSHWTVYKTGDYLKFL